MTPISLTRLAIATLLVALATPGCTRLLNPDPLNKTESIVNGTQVTRGPSRGNRGILDSGFASTAAPTGNNFEPAVGEPFDVNELAGLSSNDAALPELQGIDFGAEQGFVSDIVSSGVIPAIGGAAADENSTSYFLSDIGQSVYFATNSSELNDRARETLRRQAAWLNVNSNARVTIEGHADERGTREYNLALGDRRASATRGYLIAVGVDESRLDKTSFGKERPVALGSNEDAWAQNRRTETIISDGEAFTSNPLVSDSLIGTTSEELFPSNPVLSDATIFPDTTLLDPLIATPVASPLPGTITYDTLESNSQTQTFDSGSIAPTVFDPNTIAPPPYGIIVPVPPPPPPPPPAATTPIITGTTRIEDVSVDDLLRDPSLIDRIGTPGTTTTTAPGS